MSERNLKSSPLEWRKAYEQMVQEITGFKYYKTKVSALKAFEKLASNYPEVNPYTFMKAVFPPNQDWYIPKKGGPSRGWRKLQYPYPNMLFGDKAKQAYQKYQRQRKAERNSFEEEVLAEVEQSLKYLKQINVSLHNYEELFWQSHASYITPYLYVSLPNAIAWAMLQSSSGKIDQDIVEEVLDKKDDLQKYTELKFKIRKLIGAN